MKKDTFNFQESYGYHFISISVIIKRMMETKLKPYDLTHLQFSILMNLYKNDISTQKDILKYINGDEASITRLIDRLEKKGLIQRISSKEDKRKKHITLTEEGILLTEEIQQFATQVNKELVKNLNEDESKQLLNLLQKVNND